MFIISVHVIVLATIHFVPDSEFECYGCRTVVTVVHCMCFFDWGEVRKRINPRCWMVR